MAEYRIHAELDGRDVAMKTALGVGVVLGVAAVIVPVMIAHGFITTILWGWFLVPLGVPAIGVAHAIGLACLIAGAGIVKSGDEIKGRLLAWMGDKLILRPAVLLGVGWIAKQFM